MQLKILPLKALTSLALAFACCTPSWAQITEDAIKTKIEAAKIFKDKRTVRAKFQAPEIKVNISSPAAETEKDRKINAILIAKSVFPLSKSVLRVRVLFFISDDSPPQQVIVTLGDIKSFVGGGLTSNALLDSIDIGPAPKEEVVAAAASNATANVNSSQNESTEPVRLPAAFNLLDARKKASRLANFGKLIYICRNYQGVELSGANTARERRQAADLYKGVLAYNPLSYGECRVWMGRVFNSGYNPFVHVAPVAGASDSQHWDDLIASCCKLLRSTLGEDTPTLDGVLLGERVRLAYFVHALGEKGMDVTAHRRVLQHVDELCQQSEADRDVLLPRLQELEVRMTGQAAEPPR